jgi:hypothetical protein
MSDEIMNLRALAEKTADADLLREMIGFVSALIWLGTMFTETEEPNGSPAAVGKGCRGHHANITCLKTTEPLASSGLRPDLHLRRRIERIEYRNFTRSGRRCSSGGRRIKTTAKIENGVLGIANLFTRSRGLARECVGACFYATTIKTKTSLCRDSE